MQRGEIITDILVNGDYLTNKVTSLIIITNVSINKIAVDKKTNELRITHLDKLDDNEYVNTDLYADLLGKLIIEHWLVCKNSYGYSDTILVALEKFYPNYMFYCIDSEIKLGAISFK